MITTAPATYEHIAPILASVSEVTAAEMEALKIDAWGVHGRLRTCRGPDGAGADTIFIDGKPVAIIGAVKPDKNHLRTWFIASEAYFRSKSCLKFSREHMKKVQAGAGNRLIDAHTTSQHPNVLKWFWLLGFKKMFDEPPVSVYRYVGN